MIEVHPDLHVGAQADEEQIRAQPGWFFIHACKEPYHRDALGYTGRAAAKDHPEYLIARREGRLILNLVDVADVNYVGSELIDAALEAIRDNIGTSRILVHCNQGQSRSPTIALLYLSKFTRKFDGLGIDEALAAFQRIYPPYKPARGMADYARINWGRYRPG
jgi:predicted protein tyrosine phosphatase